VRARDESAMFACTHMFLCAAARQTHTSSMDRSVRTPRASRNFCSALSLPAMQFHTQSTTDSRKGSMRTASADDVNKLVLRMATPSRPSNMI
jgi:hypothetical protein